MREPLAVLAAAGLLGACAWGPGGGFAAIEPGAVEARLDLPASRRDAEGRWKTSNGYALAVERLALGLSGSALTAPGESRPAGSGAVFDPASPPPGYSLCHNGHCHRADGALIDYADVQAELNRGGGPAQPVTVVSFGFPQAPAVLAVPGSASLPLGSCQPDCLLDPGTIDRATVSIGRLEASGTVSAGAGLPALGPAPRAWKLDLPIDGLVLAAPVTASVSRSGPASYGYAGAIAVSEKLFDGLDWARLAQAGGTIDLAADAAAHDTLLANLAKSQWMPALSPQL